MTKKSGGRIEFKALSQTFIDITNTTANVTYLNHIIRGQIRFW